MTIQADPLGEGPDWHIHVHTGDGSGRCGTCGIQLLQIPIATANNRPARVNKDSGELDDHYGVFYECPVCPKSEDGTLRPLISSFTFCPMCGVALEWPEGAEER